MIAARFPPQHAPPQRTESGALGTPESGVLGTPMKPCPEKTSLFRPTRANRPSTALTGGGETAPSRSRLGSCLPWSSVQQPFGGGVQAAFDFFGFSGEEKEVDLSGAPLLELLGLERSQLYRKMKSLGIALNG